MLHYNYSYSSPCEALTHPKALKVDPSQSCLLPLQVHLHEANSRLRLAKAAHLGRIWEAQGSWLKAWGSVGLLGILGSVDLFPRVNQAQSRDKLIRHTRRESSIFAAHTCHITIPVLDKQLTIQLYTEILQDRLTGILQ